VDVTWIFQTPAVTALKGTAVRLKSRATGVHTLLMTRSPASTSDAAPPLGVVAPATEDETRAALLARSNRDFAPIAKVFVQSPDQKQATREGPLSEFVRCGDLRGLQAFCLLHAIISSGDGENGWSTTLPISVWARAFGTTRDATLRSASAAATKVLTRLERRKLISRTRRGRERRVTVTLLRPDGRGREYTRPGRGNDDRFLKLPNIYWTAGWHERLDLPATAMLLVALHEKPGFELPTEHMSAWYGFSPDTAERGLKSLVKAGAIQVRQESRKEPLSPTGRTKVNIYTLQPPFTLAASAQVTAGRPSPRRGGRTKATGRGAGR